MRIAFVCIDNDWFALNQIVKVCNLLLSQLSFHEEQMMILCKPSRKHKRSENKEAGCSGQSIVRKFFKKRTPKSIVSLIRHKYIVKTNHDAVKSELMRLSKIRCEKIDTVNSDKTIKLLRESNMDHVVFVYYDEIVRALFLNEFVCFNVHPGWLPEYRGCQPLYWQLKESQPISAITVHRMVEGLDEGDIIAEIPFTIYPEKSKAYNVMHTGFYSLLGNALFVAIRRLYLFDEQFGIPQKLSKGGCAYYGRPQK